MKTELDTISLATLATITGGAGVPKGEVPMSRQLKRVRAVCRNLHKQAATFGNLSTNSLVYGLAQKCDADLKRLKDRQRRDG